MKAKTAERLQHAAEVAFIPGTDPLWRNTPLPLTACYNVLGVALRVATNSPLLFELARDVFGHWGRPESDRPPEELCLRAIVHSVPNDLPEPGSVPITRAQEHYLVIGMGRSLGFADRTAGFATVFVTPALLEMPELVQAYFLECPGIYLVGGRRRATLHAAGLLLGERGVLLTGPDGVGKSTLAYACVRSGFRLLAEDVVFIQPQAPAPLAWGDPRFLHLLPTALPLFPELHALPQVTQLNGETKLRVRIDTLRPDAAVTQMPVWGVCSLRRNNASATRLLAADPEYMRHTLTHFKGDPPVDHGAMQAAIDSLLARYVAHLEVGSDLDEAVTTLRNWIDEFSGQ